MGRDGDWENMGPKGVSIAMDMVWHFRISKVFWVFQDASIGLSVRWLMRRSVTEGSFDYIYNLTEWRCDQRIELGRGLSYNTNA